MVKRNNNYSATVDAGYGLIYRLNDLWNGADRAALVGDLDKWNHILNAIFRNLCYRGAMEITYEEEDKKTEVLNLPTLRSNVKKTISPSTPIKTIKLNPEDSLVFEKFRKLIKVVKVQLYKAMQNKKRGEYNVSREDYQEILSKKDIWLRKFMQDRGLYLREVEFDPSRVMWGG